MTALATPMRPAVLSLVTVVFGVGRLATDVPAGRIADRVEAQYALAGTALVTGLGSFLLASVLLVAAVLAACAVLSGALLPETKHVEDHLAGAAVE